MTTAQQIPLRFRLDNDATLDNFYVADEAALAVHELRRQAQGAGERYIYLLAGVGRSHLLQASCAMAEGASLTAQYLPIRSVAVSSPEWVLEGLEECDLLCLDDIDAVVGDRAWEVALFNLYNAALANGQSWLVSSRGGIQAERFCLPDLCSRMKSFSTYRLPVLGDDELLNVIVTRCRARGIIIDEAVVRYILSRGRRDLHYLVDLVAQLDRSSLQMKRKVTIPFVKDVMGWCQ